ncbi:MAG: hypothetical protein NTV03_03130 [Candidatus Nomurabacteria bacterium]|nr:hypothetical protein [Candidatus Nomurabacteria bacterium]
MKNFFALVLVIICINCKKDPAILVPPVFGINITPSSMLAYGGNATINIVSKNTDYITVNGKAFSLSFETGALFQTTSFEIVAFNSDGTTKQTITVNVDKAPLPILEVLFTKDTLVFGDKTKFSWKASGLVSFLTLDGVSIGNPGSFDTPPLYKTTEYNLTVTGPGGSKTEKVIISVGDWTTSKLGLLTYNNPSWTVIGANVTADDGKIYFFPYDPTEKMYFNVDGAYGLNSNVGKWNFNDDETEIIINSIYHRKITKLTTTDFGWKVDAVNSRGEKTFVEVISKRNL